MKFIKEYKLFESLAIDEIKEDLLDITIELQDIGFRIKVTDNQIIIDKYHGSLELFWVDSNMIEVLLRISDYFNLNGYCIKSITIPHRYYKNQKQHLYLESNLLLIKEPGPDGSLRTSILNNTVPWLEINYKAKRRLLPI
jgi:hypothetical protein